MDTHALRREFARKVRSEMERKGWTQTELAKKMGVTQSSLSDVVAPRSSQQRKQPAALPNSSRLVRLCEALGLSADYLLGLSSNPKGGVPTAGQAFQDGGLRAIAEVRDALETVEANWRGEQNSPRLPTAEESAAAAEQLQLAREVRGKPGVRRQPRRKGA